VEKLLRAQQSGEGLSLHLNGIRALAAPDARGVELVGFGHSPRKHSFIRTAERLFARHNYRRRGSPRDSRLLIYLDQMRLTIRTLGKLTEESIPPQAKEDLLRVFLDWKRAQETQ